MAKTGQPIRDLTGQRFGRLTVLSFSHFVGNSEGVWLCRCDCGTEKLFRRGDITRAKNPSQSCGCFRDEKARKQMTKHGMEKTRLYRVWHGIIIRCTYPSTDAYIYYGGRGILICKEWRESFETFRDWAFANGYRDDLTIERIDCDGHYEPNNCTWIPANQQQRNRRNVLRIDGVPLVDLCREHGWSTRRQMDRIANRIFQLGWDVGRALNTPLPQRGV